MTDERILSCVECQWQKSTREYSSHEVNQRAIRHFRATGHQVTSPSWDFYDGTDPFRQPVVLSSSWFLRR
jgi:hypothetical protein